MPQGRVRLLHLFITSSDPVTREIQRVGPAARLTQIHTRSACKR